LNAAASAERIAWAAVALVVLLAAHLLPALTRGEPLQIKLPAMALWLVCLVGAGYGHATLFLSAQQHAGAQRASAIETVEPNAPTQAELGRPRDVVARDQARVTQLLASARQLPDWKTTGIEELHEGVSGSGCCRSERSESLDCRGSACARRTPIWSRSGEEAYSIRNLHRHCYARLSVVCCFNCIPGHDNVNTLCPPDPGISATTMYRYNEFDKAFVANRAAQFRDQIERWQSGKLSDAEFLPLRLQNGWYVQRHAPMLRVAVPYGELSSAQIRVLARIAREYDEPDTEVYRRALDAQRKLGTERLPTHQAHFTTRTNVQYNWIPLSKAADVMDLLATVNMHGIQTSGNCIRNISCDERAGVAPDEIADPRPFAELMRQWTTLHPEFAFLPRKFKIAISGSTEDRAATGWHDVGLRLVQDEDGELGFRVLVGGGMGRTPVIGIVLREFLPWRHIMNYIEAVVRVYNQFGRRDNKYKARIKILAKAEGQRFIDEVEEEFRQIVDFDGGHIRSRRQS
jgi:dissimilatory sulfite reductase (desulfoviridin) alpha/beta subunit